MSERVFFHAFLESAKRELSTFLQRQTRPCIPSRRIPSTAFLPETIALALYSKSAPLGSVSKDALRVISRYEQRTPYGLTAGY